ncbi:tyrosine-type recombinase/integrase [Lysinibacillus xylanilyticus]|uniref:Site-specific integrase n=1 Tax=Lysinibacillus xylanilyticus TaxID=582475 RepID=A0A2M9Q5S4_9BACI|nr:tyrosine-type recombinase/integrase [Lysinibacillus xylanilyticus]PJO43430.1 site-specific integrase [Lysinibacillus xylanilyticus]
MARRGRTSIVREVKESLTAIDKIGQSKRDARKTGTSGIHSKKQMANTMSDAQNFVKWCRSEHGVKSISELNAGHYVSYLAYLSEKGVSQGHRVNVETSLVGSDAKNRSYTEEEVQLIRENCSDEVTKAVELMREMGLRIKEAVNVRVEHFVPNDRGIGWCLTIEKGTGITKGGRFRQVDVPQRLEQRLESWMVNKSPGERIVNVSYSTVRDGVNVACKRAGVTQAGRGCHGFRHAYARERMVQLMPSEQKKIMNRVLENRKIGRAADYGILSEHDKQLYAAAREAMDQIHSELGHGKNRWALAMRYMGD